MLVFLSHAIISLLIRTMSIVHKRAVFSLKNAAVCVLLYPVYINVPDYLFVFIGT